MHVARRLAIILTLMLIPLWPQTARGQDTGLARADSLYAAGLWSAAADAYREAADADPKNVRAHVRLGMASRNVGDFDAAEGVFDRLLSDELAPAAFLYLQKALVYADAGRTSESIMALEAADQAGLSSTNVLDSDPAFDALRSDPAFRAVRGAVDRRARPCAYDEGYGQFDFWIGEWNVYMANGTLAGSNVISKTESDCLALEKWTGQSGGTGTSMNFYDPHLQIWTQQWVSASGTIIHIEGGLSEGSMVLEGDIKYAGGNAAAFRGTWTLLEDGRVRQFFEQHDPATDAWNSWFEGFYVRSE
jgi:tetratricopeptide (TPR) repeat protein